MTIRYIVTWSVSHIIFNSGFLNTWKICSWCDQSFEKERGTTKQALLKKQKEKSCTGNAMKWTNRALPFTRMRGSWNPPRDHNTKVWLVNYVRGRHGVLHRSLPLQWRQGLPAFQWFRQWKLRFFYAEIYGFSGLKCVVGDYGFLLR